jgi:hypothetical protein
VIASVPGYARHSNSYLPFGVV